MATSFESVYRRFLGMIDDYELSLISEEDLNEVMFGYLQEAITLLMDYKTDGLEYFDDGFGTGEFESDLTHKEQRILALGMKKAWLSAKLYNADLMIKSIGDRDYKAVQGTGYLRQMQALDSKLDDELHKYSVSYTWKIVQEDW